MQRKNNRFSDQKGFTILELIIVIIIMGILAGLAIPKFYSMVEYSRSVEALSIISSTHNSMQRCILMHPNNIFICSNFSNLDIDNPNSTPGRHFEYFSILIDTSKYMILAIRNTYNGGDGSSRIIFTYGENESPPSSKSGTGSFSGIK